MKHFSPEILVDRPSLTPSVLLNDTIVRDGTSVPRRANKIDKIATLSVITQSNVRRRRRLSTVTGTFVNPAFMDSEKRYFDKVL